MDRKVPAEVVSEALETRHGSEADVVRLEGEFKLVKWMLGVVLGGVPLEDEGPSDK